MSIKKSISFTFGAQIITTLIGFVSSVIITRILGAAGRGDNAIFSSATTFAVLFFGFSINSTIPYFINSGKAKAEELLSTTIIFCFASSLMVFATLFILERLGKLDLVLSGSIQSLRYKFLFTGIYISTLLNNILSIYLLTYKKFKQVSIYGVVFQAIPMVIYFLLYFNILFYDHKNTFRAVVNVIAITSFLSTIAIIILFIKTLPVRISKKLIPIGLIKQFLFFSSMAYIGNIATFFNYKLDFWVVNEYCGKSQLGIYSLAAQLSQLLWLLPSSISSVLYSYASKCTEEEAIRYAIKLKQLAFYASAFLGLTGLILAYYFIPVLYGNEFSKAFPLMPFFILGVIPFSIPIVSASLFAARGNFKASFVISIIIFVFSSSLYLILIPRYGLKGGAIASATAYFISAVFCEIWFCRQYKVSYFNLFTFEQNFFSLKKIVSYFK